MQVARFDFITVAGEIHVCGSVDGFYLAADPVLPSNWDHFYYYIRNDSLSIFTIGDHVAPLQIDIRLNEAVPSENTVLLATHFSFQVTGDDVTLAFTEEDREILNTGEDALAESHRTVLVYIFCEQYKVIDIPPGYYVLTIHQFYSGEKPLGLPEDPSEIPLDERWKWDEVPTCLTMYFNPVDSLDGIEAKERWNWPDANNW